MQGIHIPILIGECFNEVEADEARGAGYKCCFGHDDIVSRIGSPMRLQFRLTYGNFSPGGG